MTDRYKHVRAAFSMGATAEIGALLAERDELKAENERLRGEVDALRGVLTAMVSWFPSADTYKHLGFDPSTPMQALKEAKAVLFKAV